MTLLTAAGCTKQTEPVEEARSDAPVATKKQEVDNRPVIIAFGDSISEGYGVETGKSFPDQLQMRLDKEGFHYHVVNMGISGDTTTGGAGRIQPAVSMKPNIVILELGGNDGLRGIPVASTRANLEKMITAFRDAGADVLLAGMTLPPNYGPDYIRQFEAAYKDLARKYKLPLIPFLMEDILKRMPAQTNLMQRDGIHPTSEGHEIVAETVFRYLQPLLHR